MTDAPIARLYLESMASYNGWMNGKVYAAAKRLPHEEIARDRGAFFKSILGTLNHLLVADLIWLGRFKEGRPRVSDIKALLHHEIAALEAARLELDREIAQWAATVDEAWLARPFTFTSLIAGADYTFPAWILVTHMFSHQIHHRGQITTLLTQLGEDVGVTDLIGLPGLKEMA